MVQFAAWLGRYPELVFVVLMAVSGTVSARAWINLRDASGSATQRRDRRSFLARIVAFGSLAVFALLALGQRREGRQVLFDQTLADSLGSHASDTWLAAFAVLTRAGDRDLLFGLGAVVLGGLLWRRHWRDAATWLAATAGAGLLNVALKSAFERERPQYLHDFADVQGWSFPSGHATGAIACYGMLAYLLVRAAPPAWRTAIVVAATLLVVAIGYSRVVLQVHYFSDVVAGFAVTLAWLVLCMVARAWLLRRLAG